ncbi:MAG: hypothetical protein RIS41_1312 [Actinomycetota bacterium]
MNRRLPALVVTLGLAGALASVVSWETTPTTAVFATASEPGTPRLVIRGDTVSSTWFCGGTPALGTSENGEYGGEVILTNPTDSPASSVVSIFTIDRDPIVLAVDVDPRSQQIVDLDAVVSAPYVSAMVEVDRPEVAVEQVSRHPAGDAVAACTTTTSDEWYVADGFTAAGSDLRLLVTNPYPSAAIIDVEISTSAGPRTPGELQGYVVPPGSLRVLNLEDAGFRDEAVVAIGLVASTGRVVVAKDQHYLGGGRLGHLTALASPATSDEWWFADGAFASDVAERLVIFNPTDDDVQADIVVLGVPGLEADYDSTALTVPSREVVVFDVAGVPGLVEGPHALLVTTWSGPSLVVERVVTRPAGQSVVSSTLLGAQGDALAREWFVSVTSTDGSQPSLVVLNVSPEPVTLEVSSIGPGGPEPVASTVGLVLEANERLDIALDEVAGRPIVVAASDVVVVERLIERNDSGIGRLSSLALPVQRVS